MRVATDSGNVKTTQRFTSLAARDNRAGKSALATPHAKRIKLNLRLRTVQLPRNLRGIEASPARSRLCSPSLQGSMTLHRHSVEHGDVWRVQVMPVVRF